jgi:hypothetical protein
MLRLLMITVIAMASVLPAMAQPEPVAPESPSVSESPSSSPPGRRVFDQASIAAIVASVPIPEGASLPSPEIRVDVTRLTPLIIHYDLARSPRFANLEVQTRVRFARDILAAVRNAYPDFRGDAQFPSWDYYVDFWDHYRGSRPPTDFNATAITRYCETRGGAWDCYFPDLAVRQTVPGDSYEWTRPWVRGAEDWVRAR